MTSSSLSSMRIFRLVSSSSFYTLVKASSLAYNFSMRAIFDFCSFSIAAPRSDIFFSCTGSETMRSVKTSTGTWTGTSTSTSWTRVRTPPFTVGYFILDFKIPPLFLRVDNVLPSPSSFSSSEVGYLCAGITSCLGVNGSTWSRKTARASISLSFVNSFGLPF